MNCGVICLHSTHCAGGSLILGVCPKSVFLFLVAAGFEPTPLSLGSGRLNRYPILTPPIYVSWYQGLGQPNILRISSKGMICDNRVREPDQTWLDYTYRRRVSSVVEHSSANPKVPGSISDPISYWGHGL